MNFLLDGGFSVENVLTHKFGSRQEIPEDKKLSRKAESSNQIG